MKYLLLLGVLVVAWAWWVVGRRREDRSGPGVGGASGASRRRGPRDAKPATMLACVQCGVHLPQSEALFDPSGRPYCSEAHRLAGPR